MLLTRRGQLSSVWLDAMRATAAAAVALGHMRGLFFHTAADSSSMGLWKMGVYFLTGFPHQAVIVFFVLSGYFIGSGVMSSLRAGRWSWRSYLVARAARLYPALLLCLLLGTLWDHAGLGLFGEVGAYPADKTAVVVRQRVADNLGWGTLLGNVLFLQTIVVPNYGSMGPLWSLANEWWYYMCFPLLLAPWMAHSRRTKIAGVVLAAVILAAAGAHIAALFLVWLMGAAVCLLEPRKPLTAAARRGALVLAGLAFAGVLVAIRLQWIEEHLSDYVLGAVTAALIWAMLQIEGTDRGGLPARFWTRTAGFSYSLYLCHVPLIVFVRAYLLPDGTTEMTLRGALLLVLLFLGVTLYAAAIAHFTEDRTSAHRARLSAWVEKVLPRKAAPA